MCTHPILRTVFLALAVAFASFGVAELARRHDLWVVSDEVYAAFAFDAPAHSIAALPGMSARTVVVEGISKGAE